MIKNTRGILIIVLALVIIQACVKDIGKAPVTTVAPIPPDACDTITYTKHIKKIIDDNCSTQPGCHTGPSPLGNTALDTYDQVKNSADNGRIKARIIDGSPSFMPQGSQLTVPQKALITCWLENGKKL